MLQPVQGVTLIVEVGRKAEEPVHHAGGMKGLALHATLVAIKTLINRIVVSAGGRER